jgi:hypothetical protein
VPSLCVSARGRGGGKGASEAWRWAALLAPACECLPVCATPRVHSRPPPPTRPGPHPTLLLQAPRRRGPTKADLEEQARLAALVQQGFQLAAERCSCMDLVLLRTAEKLLDGAAGRLAGGSGARRCWRPAPVHRPIASQPATKGARPARACLSRRALARAPTPPRGAASGPPATGPRRLPPRRRRLPLQAPAASCASAWRRAAARSCWPSCWRRWRTWRSAARPRRCWARCWRAGSSARSCWSTTAPTRRTLGASTRSGCWSRWGGVAGARGAGVGGAAAGPGPQLHRCSR